jgi:peptidoglycan/LPS O-acetylase OafA/YrhL
MSLETSLKRIPELDLLRFLAASVVVIYHHTYQFTAGASSYDGAFPTIQSGSRFGYLGVNLFFLISGFVILWSASNKTVRQFVASRALRLYPTFWAAILLTLIAVAVLGPEGGFPSVRTIITNTTMVPGYLGSDFIDGVYWTLAVELKFYLIVAIIILFKQLRHIEIWLCAWLIALILCTMGFGKYGLSSLSLFPYGSLFVGGCWAYLIRARGASWLRLTGFLASAVLSLAVVPSQVPQFIQPVLPADVRTALLLVGLIYLTVLSIALNWWRARNASLAIYLGALTYPLYLVHNRIGRLVYASLENKVSAGVCVVLVICVSLLLSWLLVVIIDRWVSRAIARSSLYRRLSGPAPADRRSQ